jgi:predicted lipoprotein with Yx(FWY)xxD motif
MTRKTTTFIAAAAAFALLLISAGCGSSGSGSGYSAGPYGSGAAASGSPSGAAGAGAAKVGIARTAVGRIIVDNQGNTLYLFEKDKNSRSACYGACAQEWPPLLSQGTPLSRRGVTQSLLGTNPRRNGAEQVSYAGHPVYRFVGDRKAGDTNGEGAHDFGAGWDVLSPAGRKIEADDN